MTYTLTPLAYPTPGATDTYGYDINNSGQVVGYYLDGNYIEHAFLLDGQTYTTFEPSVANGFDAYPYGISNDGHVLGRAYYDPSVGGSYPFVYDTITHSDAILAVDGADPMEISASQISNAGVVGSYWNWQESKTLGFTWENGSSVSIDIPGTTEVIATSINDSGQVVGYDWDGISYHGFLEVGGVITPIDDPNAATSFAPYVDPPALGTVAQFINNDGEIAGYYTNSSGNQICFLDDHGTFTDIVVSGSLFTQIMGISDAGVFGNYLDAAGVEHGFISKDGIITTVDDPNASNDYVTAMNDSGQLIEAVGNSTYFGGSGGTSTEIGTPVDTTVVVDPTVVADHDHVNLYQTVIENAAHGVLANDTDPIPTDALSVSAVNGSVANVGTPVQGLYGALTLVADGSYSYTATHALPDDGVGFDTFSYTAETGTGGQATTDLTIVVVGSDKHYFGGTADTTINGGAYNFDGQVLDGSQGNDVLIAGKAATVEIGGPGDTLTGSTMADKFVFHGDDFGHNEITNFNVKMDTIWFDSTEFTNYQQVLADATQVGHGKNATTIINDGTGDVIQLDHVQLSALHASDFHFV
jgi:hypothetical protein